MARALTALLAEARWLVEAALDHGAVFDVLEDGRVALTDGDLPEALGARLAAFCGEHEGREKHDAYRALRAIVRAGTPAARELLGLPVAYAVGLPHPFTITFARGKTACVCTTSRHTYRQALTDGTPTFILRELEMVAAAVELGRASGCHLDDWLAAKSRGDWRLTPELAGVLSLPSGGPGLVCFGELFDALGAELVAVELHQVEPTGGLPAAARSAARAEGHA